MTEQNRPRHSLPDSDDGNASYDDEFAYSEDAEPAGAHSAAAGRGAAGVAAGSAGGAAGTGGGGGVGDAAGAPAKQGPPLRGLAMILTAVAVVLIAWGAYSVFSGDDDDDADSTAAGTTTGAPATDSAAGQSSAAPAPAEEGADSDGSADAAAGASGTSGASAAADAPEADAGSADGAAAGAGAAAGTVDRKTAVTVLNNSGEALAKDAAADIRGKQWSNTGYGNLQGRIEGISEESRVYYPEGNAGAQAAAEELAGEIGLQAQAGNPDYYSRFGEADIRDGGKADGVVVVLTQPLR